MPLPRHYKEKAGCALTAGNGYTYTKGGNIRTRVTVSAEAIGTKIGKKATSADLEIFGLFPCRQPSTSRRTPVFKGRLVVGKTLKVDKTATVNRGDGPASQRTVGSVKLTSAKTATLKVRVVFTEAGMVTCDQTSTLTLKRHKQYTHF